jgi:acetyl-CoA carboxylase biotin carboxyl carrier protein
MNLNEIKQLIDIVNSSDLQETIIEEGDFKITLRRASSAVVPQYYQQPAAAPAPLQPAPSYTPSPATQTAPPAAKSEVPSDLIECRSPIVGTFYQSSSPDNPPFVAINDTVRKGDVLCIIEAMKLMNEIEAEVSGTIVEILVENGQAVEYDQPLFRIKP